MGRHFGVEGGLNELGGVISVCFLGQFLILLQEILKSLLGWVKIELIPFAAGCCDRLGADISSSEGRYDVLQAGTVCVGHIAVCLQGVIPE